MQVDAQEARGARKEECTRPGKASRLGLTLRSARCNAEDRKPNPVHARGCPTALLYAQKLRTTCTIILREEARQEEYVGRDGSVSIIAVEMSI